MTSVSLNGAYEKYFCKKYMWYTESMISSRLHRKLISPCLCTKCDTVLVKYSPNY